MTPDPAPQARTGRRSRSKPRERAANPQLGCFPPDLRVGGARHASCEPLPPSKPERPHVSRSLRTDSLPPAAPHAGPCTGGQQGLTLFVRRSDSYLAWLLTTRSERTPTLWRRARPRHPTGVRALPRGRARAGDKRPGRAASAVGSGGCGRQGAGGSGPGRRRRGPGASPRRRPTVSAEDPGRDGGQGRVGGGAPGGDLPDARERRPRGGRAGSAGPRGSGASQGGAPGRSRVAQGPRRRGGALRTSAEQGSLAAMERLLDAFRRLDQATTLTALIDCLAEAAQRDDALGRVRGPRSRGARLARHRLRPGSGRRRLVSVSGRRRRDWRLRALEVPGRDHAATFAGSGELAFIATVDEASGLAMPVTLGGETAAVIYGDDGGAGGPAAGARRSRSWRGTPRAASSPDGHSRREARARIAEGTGRA